MRKFLKCFSIILTLFLSLNTISVFATTNDERIITIDELSENKLPESGDVTYFSDREVANILIENGYSIDIYDYPFLLERANGYNKIVWKNDGFDLYISKNTLLLLGGAGVGAVTALIAAFPPLAGAGATIIGGAIGAYVGGNITDGKIFHFKYRDGNKLAPYLSSTSTQ